MIVLNICFVTGVSAQQGMDSWCPEAGLSDEQTDQWQALRQDFKTSVEGLSKKERRAKWAEFHQQVLETIPETDEQQAALEQCFEDWEKRGKRNHQ